MTQHNIDPNHPVSQMHGLINSLLGRHGDEMTPEQRQQLNGYKQHLTQNRQSFLDNPQGMQNVFNGVLRTAAPFIIGYGVNALLGGGQQAGGYAPGGLSPSYGGGLGGGLGGLISGALPGIIGGLGGGQSGSDIGGQPPSFGNQGGSQSI